MRVMPMRAISWPFCRCLFTLRASSTLAHQAWLALGLTKYLAVDNIIRFVSLWTLLPLLLALGGTTYAVWGVALYALPTVFFVVFINRRLGLFDMRRELVVLPMLPLGALFGALLMRFLEYI